MCLTIRKQTPLAHSFQHYQKILNSGFCMGFSYTKDKLGLPGAGPLSGQYTCDFRSRIVLIKGSPTLPQLYHVAGCVSVVVLGFISR